jgi:hypothetical protein
VRTRHRSSRLRIVYCSKRTGVWTVSRVLLARVRPMYLTEIAVLRLAVVGRLFPGSPPPMHRAASFYRMSHG